MLTRIRQLIIEPLLKKGKKRTFVGLLSTTMMWSGLGAVFWTILFGIEWEEKIGQLEHKNERLLLELSQLRKEHEALQVSYQQLESKATQLANESQAANKELSEFVYMTSHDLKSPLLAVSSLASWIREDLEDVLTEGTREYMDLLERRVSRMEALLEVLLQFSRVKRQMSQPEPVDVALLIQEIIERLAPPAEFQIEIAPNMPLIVVEKAKLEQVFLQLLSNAIKHHKKPNGRVQISASIQEQFHKFTIQDDGPGIAPRFHQKIFELGQTLQSRDEVEGAGMGLTLAKKIVEHFGGQITVTSEEGQGAVFCFTWPKTGEPDA